MTLKTRLIRSLEYIRDIQLQFQDDLSEKELNQVGKPDAWTAKDNLFHAATWADRRLKDLAVYNKTGSWPEDENDNFEEANRAIFELHQDKNWQELGDMIQNIYKGIKDYLEQTSEKDLQVIIQVEEQSLWRGIAGSFITHPMIHIWDYLLKQNRTDQINNLFGEGFAQNLLAIDDDPAWQGTVYYNLACVYSLTNQLDPALKNISKALDLNPDLKEWSQQDADLAAIHDHPDFLALFSEQD